MHGRLLARVQFVSRFTTCFSVALAKPFVGINFDKKDKHETHDNIFRKIRLRVRLHGFRRGNLDIENRLHMEGHVRIVRELARPLHPLKPPIKKRHPLDRAFAVIL